MAIVGTLAVIGTCNTSLQISFVAVYSLRVCLNPIVLIKGVDTSRGLADLTGRYYSRFFLHRNGNTDRSTTAR